MADSQPSLPPILGDAANQSNASGEAALHEVLQSYVKRTRHEDVDMLEDLGGLEYVFTTVESTDQGLQDESSVEHHRKKFGPNSLPKKETSPLWKLMWIASSDPMLRVLMVAAIVSFVLALIFGENKKVEWIEGFAILVAVLIVICVTAGNDYIKEKRFAELYDHEERWVQVLRGNEKVRLLKDNVVVGDVIYMEAGDEVPADALLLQGHNMKFDEAALTGESDHIAKADLQTCLEKRALLNAGSLTTTVEAGSQHHTIPSPVLLSGSAVTDGSGWALIVAVGKHSQMGKLFSKLVVDNEPTPLQNKLNAMARDVGFAGFVAAIITFIVLLVEYGVQLKNHPESGSKIASTIVDYVVTAITIVVVAVPEGLPLAVTISLAFSVGRMLKDQNYVRRLAACETMGGASEVCSDKTGTLTKNQMEVEAFWNGSLLYGCGQPSMNGSKSGSLECLNLSEKIPWPEQPDLCLVLLHNIAINSSGFLEKEETPVGKNETKMIVKQVGSPTDCALLGFAEKHGKVNITYLRSVYKGTTSPHDDRDLLTCGLGDLMPLYHTKKTYIRLQIPFSSEKKVMTTVCIHPTNDQMYRIYTKGAAEVVLRRCAQRVDSEGHLKLLDNEKISKIESTIIKNFASIALRTICLAYKDAPIAEIDQILAEQDAGHGFWEFEYDYICLGIVGIRDPLRDEVPNALQDCRRAGVKVRMCTGDNIETAKQIALKAGIYHPESGGIAMLGPDFLNLVGGVVCKHCRTEKCPCETGATVLETVDEQADSDLINSAANEKQEKSPQCGLRRHKKAKAGAGKREDALLRPEAFEKIADHLEVMARSQPTDKYALVTGLKSLGRVVAVTGDGTNDAPALKKADVGFAMGITGKETAKQAADIVLMDDNFTSIVKAIKWGRNVYDNIQRFLQFQLTVNITAVIVAFVGACMLRASPLTAVQLLWVNLIMDTFAALALATELPSDKLLNRPPHSRNEYLVSKAMWRNIIVQVIYQVAVMMFVIFWGDCWLPEWTFKYRTSDPNYSIFSGCGKNHVRSGRLFHPFTTQYDYLEKWTNDITPSRHYTYVFNIFVFMQAFNLVNARKIGDKEFNIWQGLHRNVYWLAIMTIIIVGQILIVQFGGRALNVHKDGLTWQQWLICIAFGLGTWVAGSLAKLIPSSVIQHWVPESHNKEVNVLNEPASLALASRGRISSGRISSRMNIGVQPQFTPHTLSHSIQPYLQPPKAAA